LRRPISGYRSVVHEQRWRPRCERFEYRVWGAHRGAPELLAALADDDRQERAEDWYVLLDDPAWNVKIRRHSLKVKYRVASAGGFQLWATFGHGATLPPPLDSMLGRLGRVGSHRWLIDDLPAVIAALRRETGVQVICVSKRRRRYRIADSRAEVADIMVRPTGEVLHTLSVEGDDLHRLRTLCERLGVLGEANLAVHEVLRVGRPLDCSRHRSARGGPDSGPLSMNSDGHG
jgi:uncharacterized protein (UPF0248 family)